MRLSRNLKILSQTIRLTRVLCVVLVSYSAADFAATPKFLLTPNTRTQATLATNQTVTISYQVTNQTKTTRTLTMEPINGAAQITTSSGACANQFTLSPGSSCDLVLRFEGSPTAATIAGGPVICKTKSSTNNNPDPFLCSQPVTADQLLITRIPARSQLSISPSSLTLTAGSPYTSGTITVTNNSSRTIDNVAANLGGTVLSGYVTQDASQCTTLASGATCNLIFTPTSTAVSSTSFPIQGANSKAVGAKITINNTVAPSLSATNSPLAVTAGSLGTLTVQNTSTSVDAYNVTAYPLSSALSNANVTTPAIACVGPIAPGATCDITIDASMSTTAVTSSSIVVQATNNNSTENATTGALVAINGSVNLSLNPSSLIIYADGSTTGSMTITNGGTLTANDVSANFAGTALYGNVSASICSSISPGGSCVMTFTAGTTTVSATEFPISSSSPVQTVTGTIALQAPRIYYSQNSSSAPVISLCEVNPTSGLVSGCADALNDSTVINAPWGMAVNSSNTYLYIANSSQVNNSSEYAITQCTINATSGGVSNCTPRSDATFNHPISVYVNTAGTYAYIANEYGNTVSICPIASDGSFSSCSAFVPSVPDFTRPTNIILNPSGTMAYISYFGSQPEGYIAQCQVSGGGATLSNCQQTLVNDSFNANGTQLFGLAINPTDTIVYTKDFVNEHYFQCYLDSSGFISSCPVASAGFGFLSRVSALAINTAGNYLYSAIPAANYEVSSELCTISNNVITTCSNSGSSLPFQYGVALLND